MDAPLNIITKISGQSDYNALVDKWNEGTASINEQAKAVKMVTQIYRDLKGGVNDVIKNALAPQIVTMKETVTQGMDPLTTANGRMMQSYFRTGEALRVQTAFTGFLSKGFQSLGMETEKATQISQGFGSSLGMVVGVVGVAVGAIMGLKKAFDMAMEASRMELLQSTMQQMAQKDGVDFAKVLDQINSKIGNMVSHYEILQGAMKLSLLDVGWDKMADVMQLAEQRSKLIGISFTEMLNVLEQAAMGGQRALRKMLMPQDFSPEKVYKEYAASLGVLADELSDVGKKHALFNAILKTAAEQNLQINSAADAQLEKYEKLDTAWKNLGEEAGKFATALTPAISGLTTLVGYFISGLEKANAFKWALVDIWNWLEAHGGNTDYLSGKKSAPLGIATPGISQAMAISHGHGEGLGSSPIIPDFTYDSDISGDINQDKLNKRLAKEKEDAQKQAREDFLSGISAGAAGLDENLARQRAPKLDQLISGLPGTEKLGNREDEWEKGLKPEKETALPKGEVKLTPLEKELTHLKESFSIVNIGVDAFKTGITGLTQGLTQAFTGLLNGSKNLGQTFVEFGKTIIDTMVQIAAEAAAKSIVGGILKVLALAGGGDVSFGGGLKFAANGMNINYGNDMQAVMMGERGPELGLFGKNGARIFSHTNTIQMMNQASQASRSGGNNGNAQLARAFQSLADKITPASASEVHYAMIKQANIRSGSKM